MYIRTAQAADAPAMGRVMVETYLRAHRGQVPDEAWRIRQAEWTPEASATGWARSIRAIAEDSQAHECIYIAVEDATQPEQVIGIVMGGPSGVAGYEGVGDIYALYVDFAHHGRGIGRKLIQAAAKQLRARSMTSLIIRSLPVNEPANRFYESLGGQLVGECAAEDSGYPITQRIYHWPDSALRGDIGHDSTI